MKFIFSLCCILLFPTQSFAQSDINDRVREVMAGEIRTADDRARDANRMPPEVLSFMRLEDDMTVIELLPFGGWYTKILGPLLRENGKLYVTQPNLGMYSDALAPTIALPGLDRVESVDWNAREAGGRELFIGTAGDWEVEPVDMVLTFRNYHNFNYEDRMSINRSAYSALKPGGYYGVVDHTRRHMEPGSRENGRRVDPVLAIKEIQDSGFILVDYTDLLHRSSDNLDLEVGNPEVSGATDRFTFLFMKPE